MAQLVEHILGKDEVTGSTPVSSSTGGKTPPFLSENGYCRFLLFTAGFTAFRESRLSRIFFNRIKIKLTLLHFLNP